MDFATEQRSQIQAPDARYRQCSNWRCIDKQTNVQAVLQSLHKLLSAVIHFDSVAIRLLTEDGKSLRLLALVARTGGTPGRSGS